MTIDEAKNKWCPMARVSATPTGDLVSNRPYNVTACLADECMLWVKSPSSNFEGCCGLISGNIYDYIS